MILLQFAFLENFDIIGVTESWINTEKRGFLAEYNIQGYSLFNCERQKELVVACFFMRNLIYTHS